MLLCVGGGGGGRGASLLDLFNLNGIFFITENVINVIVLYDCGNY